MRSWIWLVIMLCSMALVSAQAYTAPSNPENAPLMHSGIVYVAPLNPENVPLLHGVEVQVNFTGPTIVNACGNVILFHTQNLNCTFNATDYDAQELVWAINDSRVQIISLNTSGQVFDNPSLQDYNLPSCWSIKVNVTDTDNESASSIFQYCINDTAPTFNETIQNVTITNTSSYSALYNWSDAEGDNASIVINNCSLAFNVSINNLTRTINLSRIAGGLVNETYSCSMNLSDTVLNTTSNLFVLLLIIDPNGVANYTVTNGTNFSSLRPVINLSVTTINHSYIRILNASNVTNNHTYIYVTGYNYTTENASASNPFFRVNNSDTQLLNAVCKLNETLRNIEVRASPQFHPQNATNLSTVYTVVQANVSANSSVGIYPYFNYVRFNITAPRNDSVTLICAMEVP